MGFATQASLQEPTARCLWADDHTTIPIIDCVLRRIGAMQDLTRCRPPRPGIAPAGRAAIV